MGMAHGIGMGTCVRGGGGVDEYVYLQQSCKAGSFAISRSSKTASAATVDAGECAELQQYIWPSAAVSIASRTLTVSQMFRFRCSRPLVHIQIRSARCRHER